MKTENTYPTNYSVLLRWVDRMGGPDKAAPKMNKAMQGSLYVALDMAHGRYPSLPSPLAQRALAKLVGVPVHVLFPGASRRQTGAIEKNRTA